MEWQLVYVCAIKSWWFDNYTLYATAMQTASTQNAGLIKVGETFA